MRKVIPCHLAETAPDNRALTDFIQQILPQLAENLTDSIRWYSPDARLVPGSLKFISLEALGNSRYKLNYGYQWNVFNACLDIDATEAANEAVNFTLTGSALIFELIDSEQGSVADEL